MKKMITLTAMVLTSITFNASAAMDPSMESKLVAVCKTGLSDNISLYNRTIRENNINKRLIFPKLVCNGQSFHDFALSNGANKIAEKIAPYSPGTTSITDLAITNTKEHSHSVNF